MYHRTPKAVKETETADLGAGSLDWIKRRIQYEKHSSWQNSKKPRNLTKSTQADSSTSEKPSSQKTWESTVENGQQAKADSDIKHQFTRENSKQQTLTAYTDGSVTKDQSGWGFTVKQGVITNHEDSVVAYNVVRASLTMEMEAPTHALPWIASKKASPRTSSTS